jgi:hypothetical protein
MGKEEENNELASFRIPAVADLIRLQTLNTLP